MLKDYYQPLLEQSILNWEEFTTGKKRNPPTKFIVSQNKFTPQKQLVPKKPSDLPQIAKKQEFRNTFANEMRTIAQSQLIKQLERRKTESIAKLDDTIGDRDAQQRSPYLQLPQTATLNLATSLKLSQPRVGQTFICRNTGADSTQ